MNKQASDRRSRLTRFIDAVKHSQSSKSLAAIFRRYRQRRALRQLRALVERCNYAIDHYNLTGCSWKTAWRRSQSLFFREV